MVKPVIRDLSQNVLADLNRYKQAILQSGLLFGAQIAMVLIGFLIKNLQTTHLGPKEYGLYAFVGSIVSFSAIFFRFGYFSSLQVLLARNKEPQKEKDLIGLGLSIALRIGLAFVAFLVLLSFIIEPLFGLESNMEMDYLLLILSPLCFAVPMRYFILACSFGTNRVRWAAVYDLFPKVLFLGALIMIWKMDSFNLSSVLFWNFGTILSIFLVTLIQLGPSFNNQGELRQALRQTQKQHGKAFYWGTLAAYSTYRVDELFITKMVDTTALGFYTLAGVLCAPMTMLSSAIAQSSFKKFASAQIIPKKLFFYNALWLLAYLAFISLTGKYWVRWIFGEEFNPLVPYIFPLALAYLFQGLYQPYMFLTAKGQGKLIRNIAYVEAFVNIVGNIILIPIYGVMGAIYTSIFAKAIHFIGKHYYYLRFIKTNHGT